MKKEVHIFFICMAAVAMIATVPCFVYVVSAPLTGSALSGTVFFWMTVYAAIILHSAKLLNNAKNNATIPLAKRSRRRGPHLFVIVWLVVTSIAMVGYLLYILNKPIIGPVGDSPPSYEKLVWVTVYYCIFAVTLILYSACHLHAIKHSTVDDEQINDKTH